MTATRLIAGVALLFVATAVLHAQEKPPAAKRDYRTSMRKFVQDISAEAKKANPALHHAHK